MQSPKSRRADSVNIAYKFGNRSLDELDLRATDHTNGVGLLNTILL